MFELGIAFQQIDGIVACCKEGEQKRKILLDIYHGNIAPSERTFKNNPEHSEAAKALTEAEEHLKSILTDEGKAHLEAYEKAQYEISSYDIENAFTEGFCMGARVMLAVLTDDEDTINPI